ncbi:MAG: hypothetical protein ACOCW8_03260 [bacterium]
MTLVGVLFAIVIALLVGALFYYVFRTAGPWGSFWTILLILLLAGLAAAIWVEPTGPQMYDVAWIPILFVILLFAILLAAATPARSTRNLPPETEAELQSDVAAIGGFFWLLLIILAIAVIIGIVV